MSHNSLPCGLILRFQKRQNGINTSPILSKKRYTMFGYYDDLEILRVDRWLNFSPRGMEEATDSEKGACFGNDNETVMSRRRDCIDVDREPVSRYDVKLLLPENLEQQNLPETIFDYDIWCDKGTSEAPLFVSVVLLRMTNKFLSTNESQKEGLQKLISFLKDECKDSFDEEEMRCAAFSTLGSFDYAILFSGSNLKSIFSLTEALRTKWRIDGEKRVKPYAISNIYMTQGFRAGLPSNAFDEATHINQMIPLQISMRFLTGVTTGKFVNVLQERIETSSQLKKWFVESKNAEDIKESMSLVRGRYDCQMSLECPLRVIVDLYGDDGPLSSKDIIGLIVEDINTTILTPIEDSEGYGAKNQVDSEEFEALLNEFEMTQKAYRSFLVENSLHYRTERAVVQMFVLFRDMYRNCHNMDVFRILSGAFHALFKYLVQWIDKAETLKAQNEMGSFYEIIQEIEENVAWFRNYIGNYLMDLAHSERGFIEGLKLSHSSVESATKLLLAYNSILNQLVESVSRPAKDGNFQYAFVVVSGGCDQTQAITLLDLHTNVVDNKIEENRLFVIQMSEMSIFDIRGTLLRIFHEAWHFCGNRLRNYRKEAWMESLSQLLADSIAKTISQAIVPIQKGLVENAYVTDSNAFESELNNSRERERKKLCGEIAKEIKSVLNESIKDTKNELDLYADRLIPRIKNTLLQWLLENTTYPHHKGTDALSVVYNKFCESFVRWLDDSLDICKKFNGLSYTFSVMREREIYFQNSDCECDTALSLFFATCLQLYACNNVNCQLLSDKLNLAENEIQELEQQIFESRVDNLCDIFQSGCTEALSDVMAISTLGANVEDYLLSFVYESWHMDQALPTDLSYALRIGLTLECCFEINSVLGESDKKGIKERCARQISSAVWLKERIDEEALLKRIEEILIIYHENYDPKVTNPIVEYLKKCMETIKVIDENQQKTMEKIRNMYKKLSQLDGDNTSALEAVNSFLKFWNDLNRT